MMLLRAYLLGGLILHKLVWETLKRQRTNPGANLGSQNSTRLLLVKAVKIGILLGIAAQTLMPEVLPIAQEPTTLRIVGVAIYTAGMLMAIVSRMQLGRNWSDIEDAQVIRDQAVIASGLYRYIRHPIYVGDLLLLIGLELSLNSWLVIVAVLIAPVILRQAISEEKMLLQSLPGYGPYCLRTKRFIPFIV